MFDRPTRLFLRWRDRGDATALAELFDRTAPELLRLGLHLCGNVADAEDLLQGTFLAAIESAGRFEKGKRVTPWLVGILTHRAQAERRRSKRAPVMGGDGDILPATEDSPETLAVRSELGEAARAALDGLREPFRQPTLLRFVHGMEPAEIALVLNRSPGTVRAQIHRGIEQARRALPAGVVAFAVTVGCAGRGLAAVKQVVVGAGAKATAATITGAIATTSITAGVLMGKKVLAGLAVAAGAFGLWTAASWFGGADAAPDAAANAGSSAAVAATRGEAVAPTSFAGNDTPVAERTTAPAAEAAGAWTLRVKVVDGPSNQPIEGALVELFGPRSMTLLELQRELADVSLPGTIGVPLAYDRSVALPNELPTTVTLDGALHPFLVPPAEASRALATMHTAADGTFDVAMPPSGGVLEVSAQGHAVRHVALAARLAVESEVIRLWPTRRVVGRVLTDHGEVPPIPIRLVLSSDEGCWSTTTDTSGRFEAEIATDYAMVESRTPGWTATSTHFLPNGARWISPRRVSPGDENTIYVTRFGAARLHVTDAATGAPIEVIGLRTYDAHRFPRHCGRFVAPDGWFSLDVPGTLNVELEGQDRSNANRTSLTVWSDGYLPFACDDVLMYGPDPAIVEARLTRGTLPAVTGKVVRDDRAVAGARISLRPFSDLNWQNETHLALAAQTTATDGSFRLTAPPGEHLCEVFIGSACEVQFSLSLPHEEPLVVDLASAVHVDVTVVDAKGQPQPNHNVAVTGERHQQRQGKTGQDGRLSLGPFAPGTLRVMAPLVPAEFSWSEGATEVVSAAAGTRPAVTLRLQDTSTIRVSLAFDGRGPETGFAGFVASSRDAAAGDAVPVEPNGIVPFDVLPGSFCLRVEAPDNRRWEMEIPTGTPPGAVLTLRWGGLAYAGIVTNEDGKPLANGRVFATPVGGGASASVRTNVDGSFRFDGLEPREHSLGFAEDLGSPYREQTGNRYSMQFFRPAALPAPDPTPMQIRIVAFRDGKFVGKEEMTVSGRVVDTNGAPIGGALVSLMALERQEGGTLELFPISGWRTCNAAGAFRIRVARGERYAVSLSRRLGEPNQTDTITLPATTEVQRDFVLK